MSEGSKGNLFIDRPVLAGVIAIIMVLVGVLSIFRLPVAQFPQIAPPTVSVTASYPGATATVVEETVATPIEQKVNGAEAMLYMDSISSNDGSMTLTTTFEIGRDLDLANVDVQNRVSLANSMLPADVIKEGLTIQKKSPDMVMVVSVYSPDGSLDDLFLSNYVSINVQDTLARIPGVGAINLVGAGDYGMRIWVDPDKLQRLGLSASEVYNAIQEQNVQAPAGQLGMPPAPPGTQFQLPIRVKGRLVTPEEFQDIILVARPDGTTVRIRDVASVELGAKDYTSYGHLNKKPSALLIIYQLPSANALDVATQVTATLEELSSRFPAGLAYSIPYDATKFVTVSIEEVIHTFVEAVILVFLVVYIFLQSWRATIIPLITVPVSIIGTFALFGPLGFSINTLTLFGLVLAIGIVVDDAIVVVEAAMHHIEQGMTPKEATRQAMREITGAIIGVTFALNSVFIPLAFMTGLTGQLYQQFALTLAGSVLISAINALTLSPALCGVLLKPGKQGGGRGPLAWFFRQFNAVFDRTTTGYVTFAGLFARKLVLAGVLLAGAYVGAGLLGMSLPTGLVPDEDEGVFFAEITLPQGASQERTQKVVDVVEDRLLALDGVEDVILLGAYSMTTNINSPNVACAIVRLKDWSVRKTPALQLGAIVANARQSLKDLPEADTFIFIKPPIPGVGNVGGIQFLLQDTSGNTPEDLAKVSGDFLAECRKEPMFAAAFTAYNVNTPQIEALVDREKAKGLGVPVNEIFQTLQIYLGGLYVNDFNMFGRSYRVMLQSMPDFRVTPEDMGRFYVKSASGDMIALSTLVDASNLTGPQFTKRHNLYRTAEINLVPAPGVSTGQAIARLKELAAANLPQGYSYDWGGTAYQEVKASGQTGIIFALAILFCFLVLAAQYESWSLPFAVMLSVPLAALGAFMGQWLHGLDLNVYAQIGLVMLVGLAAKNAILIVEFASDLHKQGQGVMEAAMHAARLRFRPILMTSFAFILGVLPLVLASGAGANSRVALGVSVAAGMLMATICGVFVIPALYVAVNKLVGKRQPAAPAGQPDRAEHAP